MRFEAGVILIRPRSTISGGRLCRYVEIMARAQPASASLLESEWKNATVLPEVNWLLFDYYRFQRILAPGSGSMREMPVGKKRATHYADKNTSSRRGERKVRQKYCAVPGGRVGSPARTDEPR